MSLGHKERWLVISTCQATGLGNCFSLLYPEAEVESCDIWSYQRDIQEWKQKIPTYTRIVVSQEILDLNLVDFSQCQHLILIPGVFFRGYHPDLCGVGATNGQLISTPLDVYNSVIAFAGYKSGLTVNQTAELYRDEIYKRIGFHDAWDVERENLFALYDRVGLDIRKCFLNWIRNGRFMHSFNHPKIEVLYDIASLVVDKIKGSHPISDVRPHDNLLTGPIFPTYPEIAERRGVADGSYNFKISGEYKIIDLKDFIQKSFAVYEKYPREAMSAHSIHYDSVMQLIAEEKI